MRISTSSIFAAGASQLSTLQAQMVKTQLQMSSSTKVLTAADDPIAAARALEVTQSQSINTQFLTNRQNARSSLSQVDTVLQSTVDLVTSMQSLAIKAGNAALSQADRASLATELSGQMDDLLGLANSSDGAGNYLFSGYKSTTAPFTQTATGAQYNGDQGQRVLQVGTSRQVPISASGSSVFENNATGNGTFTTVAGAANAGSGIIAPGVVANATQLTGHTYSLAFAVSGTPAVTTYTVTDTTTNTVVPPPPAVAAQPYTSGQPIAFDGVSFDIKGDPADGDTFSVAPSQKQSLFSTVTDLIATLRAPSTGAAGQASLTNGLNTAIQNLSNAMDNVLSVQAAGGSSLKELDNLDSAGSAMDVQYEATLTDLTGLDYNKAASDLVQQQTTLQAAQQSFAMLSKMSLFNYI
jgi:flagellar hook-associated protein 3 FlgL